MVMIGFTYVIAMVIAYFSSGWVAVGITAAICLILTLLNNISSKKNNDVLLAKLKSLTTPAPSMEEDVKVRKFLSDGFLIVHKECSGFEQIYLKVDGILVLDQEGFDENLPFDTVNKIERHIDNLIQKKKNMEPIEGSSLSVNDIKNVINKMDELYPPPGFIDD